MKTLRKIAALTLGASLLLTSCNKEDDSFQITNNPNQSMQVRMTDNPGNYASLDVEITSVSAYNSDSGEWIELNGNAQTVSVLELTNGEETQLAFRKDLKAGLYTKLKIEFSQNNQLVLNSTASAGTSFTQINVGLNVNQSSTVNETVILEINEEISSTAGASILVDFNVLESVIEDNGSYMIDPHLTVIRDESTGAQGHIESDIRAALEFTPNGSAGAVYTAYTDENGRFMVRGMADGTYDLHIFPDQDEDENLDSYYKRSDVVIVKGEITAMGEISLQ